MMARIDRLQPAVRIAPMLSAFLSRGAPDPGAPPCIRQRFLPATAGDLRTRARLRPAAKAIKHRAAGVEFIDENGGGPGVRLRKRQRLRKPK